MLSKKTFKKTLALITAIVMLAALAVGCGNTAANGGATVTSTAVTSQAASTVAETPKEPVKLTFWHYFNDRETIMNDFAKQYEQETGVQVEMSLYNGDTMKEKQQAAAAANQLPDIWAFIGGNGDICRYADGGNILKLDDALAEWGNRFDKVVIDQMAVTEVTRKASENPNAPLGYYALPLDTNNMQLLYNKDLFTKAGLDAENPPKTWTEFLDAGKKLNAAGIIPFASGLGSWAQISLASIFQFEFMGADNINKARTMEMKFKDAGLEQALNEFVEMNNAKMFADGSATMDLPTAEKMFVNGQVAMIYDGSWALGVFKSMNPEFKNYGVFLIPKDERAQYEPLIPGGIGAFLTVNAKSANTAATLDFLKWLTDKPQQVKYSNESLNLPANNTITDADKLAPQLLQFSQTMSKIQPTVAGERQSIADIYNAGLSLIINGSKTPAELVKELDEKNK